MDLGMTYEEVKLAMRIIHLRKGSMKAGVNGWNYSFVKDLDPLLALQRKGHAESVGGFSRWRLTNQGIQQLKQQIGEFYFNKRT